MSPSTRKMLVLLRQSLISLAKQIEKHLAENPDPIVARPTSTSEARNVERP